MRKVLVFMLLSTLLSPALAKDYFFKEISTHATILGNSDIVVQENYTYSFDGNFTYVYRILYLSEIDSITGFRVWNAETGQQYTPSVSARSDEVSYSWDIAAQDEDQTYVMEYTIVGAIKDHNNTVDYLWYSIVPVDREKRIETVKFWITFPQDARDVVLPRASRNCTMLWVADDTLFFATSGIPAYGAFDAEFYLPEDMVEFYMTPSEFASMVFSLILVLCTLALFGTFIFVAWKDYNQYGRDPIVQDMKTVRRLRPALAGTVLDERVDIKEIEATILDLAIRGYIYIREEEKGTIFKRKEIWFVKTKGVRGLMEYEAKIMRALFGTKEKIKVSSLKNKFYKHTPKILEAIHDEAAKHKLFDGSVDKTIKSYMGKFMVFPIVLAVAVVGLIALFFGMGFRARGIFPFAMVLSFLSIPMLFMLAFAFAMAMPRKTEKGVAQAHRYTELKNWMKKYPLKEGRLFDEYLPYATAFGIQRVWIKKLKDIEGYQSDWYSGPYTAAGFVALHSSLGSSFAAPGSSGGGGGFGGGGGAGGGGAGAG
jgi:uncharacterized membrane protein